MEETICISPIIVVTDTSEKQLETFCFLKFHEIPSSLLTNYYGEVGHHKYHK